MCPPSMDDVTILKGGRGNGVHENGVSEASASGASMGGGLFLMHSDGTFY